MSKIKNCIKNWLFSEELKELKELKTKNNEFYSKIDSYQKKVMDQHYAFVKNSSKNIKAEALKLLEEELGQVAIDVNQREPSWAVICVRGQKRDMVRFTMLPDSDINEIGRFLKRFEGRGKHVVDTPYQIPRKYFI